MMLANMAQDIYEALGEDSRFNFRLTVGDPTSAVSTTSKGWQRIMRAFDRAQVALANWKVPGTNVRFRWPGGTTHFTTGTETTVTGICQTSSTTTTINLALSTYTVNQFAGWIVKVDTEYRTVAISDEDSLTLASALGTSPTADATTYTLYAPYIEVDSSYEGETVLQVYDVSNGVDLEMVRPEHVNPQPSPTTGNATAFYQVGNRIYLEPVPESGYFRVEINNPPSIAATAAATDEPSLPEQFHYGMILWALAWGFGIMINGELRQMYRTELREYMLSIQFPEDGQMRRQDDHLILKTE